MIALRHFIILIIISAILFLGFFYLSTTTITPPKLTSNEAQLVIPTSSPTPTPPHLPSLPNSHIIPLRHHVFQTFNNCGPASLSMQLSYHGIDISQNELGQLLRPYQVPQGINDDKSVTLEEMAEHAKSYGLTVYHRPNGDVETLKQFIAHDMPVVIRTWLTPDEDIGHYRLIRGYDDTTQEIIQDDSLQDKNLRYTYDYLLEIWQPFNNEYLVLVPKEKEELAKQILGENIDEKIAWQNAKKRIEKQLADDPDNMQVLFNMSIASYHFEEYGKSIEYYEKVADRLPFRTLWYQIEPIEAYFAVKDYDQVFAMTEKIFANHNRAFSELYYLRGLIYKEQGNIDAARSEFELAVHYNENFTKAKQELTTL